MPGTVSAWFKVAPGSARSGLPVSEADLPEPEPSVSRLAKPLVRKSDNMISRHLVITTSFETA